MLDKQNSGILRIVHVWEALKQADQIISIIIVNEISHKH